ncbi:MAG: hypothetical protein ACTTIA_07025 [Candidatus Cryptobacteroides sp.]|jgi:hypothetical protein
MDKLQELTDRLYNEGLSKGKEDGAALLAQAQAKSDEIIKAAKKEAAGIITKANKEAEDMKIKVEGDLKMAASQAIQATKKDIENIIVTGLCDENISKTLSSADFVKDILKAVAEKFNAEQALDLNVILPDSLKNSLEPFVKNELSKTLKGSIKAEFSKKISGGFNIGPKDGSYFVSFTDETFKELISSYLRPTTKKLLFGE